MKVYTKKGDKGQTSLIGGTRVSKASIRIESYGTVDELNSYIGLIREEIKVEESKALLESIQNDLFLIGANLASCPEKSKMEITSLKESHIEKMELAMDAMNEELPAMTHFVLPGGTTLNCHLHIARCITRRAERITVQLAEESVVDEKVIMYLNRLSDYLFVLARYVVFKEGAEELKWVMEK